MNIHFVLAEKQSQQVDFMVLQSNQNSNQLVMRIY